MSIAAFCMVIEGLIVSCSLHKSSAYQKQIDECMPTCWWPFAFPGLIYMVIKHFMKLSSLVLQIPFYLLLLIYVIPTWTGEYDFYFLCCYENSMPCWGELQVWLSGITQIAKNSLKCDISTVRDKWSQDEREQWAFHGLVLHRPSTEANCINRLIYQQRHS